MVESLILLFEFLYLNTVVIDLLLKLTLLALELAMRIVQDHNHLLDFVLVLLHLKQAAVDVALVPLEKLFTALLLMGDGGLQQTDLLLIAEIEFLNGGRKLLLVCL